MMLSDLEFNDWCRKMSLSIEAKALIQRIRTSPPYRNVGSNGKNVRCFFPSRKMGVTIQCESHRNELAAAYELEHDNDVLEYYDQPGQIKLVYLAKNSKRVGTSHCPDFFVLRKGCAGWEECKEESELDQLREKSPNRYLRDESGNWTSPPAEEYSKRHGFYYRIRSSKNINWIFQRNIQFLQDYLLHEHSTIPEVKPDVFEIISLTGRITLEELFVKTEKEISRDEIYYMIATGGIFVDLKSAPLVEPEKVQVFANEESSAAWTKMFQSSKSLPAVRKPYVDISPGLTLEWDGQSWQVLNVGETAVSISRENRLVELPLSSFQDLVRTGRVNNLPAQTEVKENSQLLEKLGANKKDLEVANSRYDIISDYLRHKVLPTDGKPTRTLFHHLAAFRQAEAEHGCGYIGLLPKKRSGNRLRKLPPETLNLLHQFIEERYKNIRQMRMFEVHSMYVQSCEQQGLLAASYRTFVNEIKRLDRYATTLKRKGPVAAYKHEPFYWTLEMTTPRHGDRPFEICHVDHTQLDIELVCPYTKENLGRPWMTIMMDAYSRRGLAAYVTHDPPSFRSCMMAIRECVRRFGRLPQILVVDGGKDLNSIYMRALMAYFRCLVKVRPGKKPRYGSVCERLFGTTNTQFTQNLLGNTQLTKNVREVTKDFDPKEHAAWTPERFYIRFCEYLYDVYDNLKHSALGNSPRETFLSQMAKTGDRSQRYIPWNSDFFVATLPTTPRGQAKVIPNIGTKINNIYYWCEAFRDPKVEGTTVAVRYDPFDAGTAYAFVRDQWIQCQSEYFSIFHGRSEREIRTASEELRKRLKRDSKSLYTTAKQLGAFLLNVQDEEKVLLQQRRDRAGKQIINSINQGFESAYPESDDNLELTAGKLSLPEPQNNPPAEEAVQGDTQVETNSEIEVFGEY